MQKTFIIVMFCISLIIALKNIFNSFLIELDINKGMNVKEATEKHKFRFRKWCSRQQKHKKEASDTCQKSK